MTNKKKVGRDPFPFWRKIIFLATFFIVTPIALLTSLFSLFYLSDTNLRGSVLAKETINLPSSDQNYNYPSSLPSMSVKINTTDARAELIRQYLEKANSPLEPHAEFIVKTADKYQLDYRLITAIAQKESGLCRVIPENSYNCWGWGIHSKGTLRFHSYREAIEAVSKGIRENYINKGYVSVQEIMNKWVPHSPNGAWAKDVDHYLNQLQ